MFTSFSAPVFIFKAATKRALWNLGDYGVSADAWQLYSRPLREAALHQQELWVLRIESMARLERQNYMQAKQNLQWDMHNIRERLHEARAISRIQPYLRRDSSQREKTINPAQSRGARNEDVEKRG